MSDEQLNEAIHTEVEGWKEAEWGAFRWMRNDERTWSDAVLDYRTDPEWCVAMIEKHRLSLDYQEGEWAVGYAEDPENPGYWKTARDPSLTRAVALAVLELTRRMG